MVEHITDDFYMKKSSDGSLLDIFKAFNKGLHEKLPPRLKCFSLCYYKTDLSVSTLVTCNMRSSDNKMEADEV